MIGPSRSIAAIDNHDPYANRLSTIITSVRPFGQDAAYAKLQQAAIQSWLAVTNKIIFFNMPEDTGGFDAPGVSYIGPDTNPPSLRQMLLNLRDRPIEDVVALVNGDIILGPEVAKLPRVAHNSSLGISWACTSFRYTYTDGLDSALTPEQASDQGLDFFCTTARIWNDVAKEIPGVVTLGRSLWDNWLNTWFHTHIDPAKYFDLTPWRCVFHPKHGGRDGRLAPIDGTEVHKSLAAFNHGGGIPSRKFPKP